MSECWQCDNCGELLTSQKSQRYHEQDISTGWLCIDEDHRFKRNFCSEECLVSYFQARVDSKLKGMKTTNDQ